MIRYIKGNLLQSNAQVLVNPVNTAGTMGKGLAKIFRDQYPNMYKRYKSLCLSGELKIGSLWIYKAPQKWILNFPTKTHWKAPSEVTYIEAGLKKFADNYEAQKIQSIAFPQLGCGNGQLLWESQVQPLMEAYLSKLSIPISIYICE